MEDTQYQHDIPVDLVENAMTKMSPATDTSTKSRSNFADLRMTTYKSKGFIEAKCVSGSHFVTENLSAVFVYFCQVGSCLWAQSDLSHAARGARL